MTSRQPPVCFGPFSEHLTQIEVLLEQRRWFVDRPHHPQRVVGDGNHVQRAAAPRELIEHVMRGQRAVLLAPDRYHNDHRTFGVTFLLLLCCLEDAFEQLAAVWRTRPRHERHDRSRQSVSVRRVLDQPLCLTDDGAEGHFAAALHQPHKAHEASAKNAGAVVVDDDGDLDWRPRELRLQDFSRLAVFLDREIVGDEVYDWSAVLLKSGDEDGAGPGSRRRRLRTGGQVGQGQKSND